MNICVVVGTRPEIIKMSPIIHACTARAMNCMVINTGQHYDYALSRIFFEMLDLPPAHCHLGVGSGTHGRQTGQMLILIEEVLLKEQPDIVLVQGDTNSVLAGALAAAKLQIAVGHVEAGLRSYDRTMPEETNRVLVDHAADLLFAPTSEARGNLLHEGISTSRVHVTGNTIVDAVLHSRERAKQQSRILAQLGLEPGGYFLATVHRSENVDCPQRLHAIFQGFACLCERYAMPVVLPIHPRTRKALERFELPLHEQVHCIPPVGYLDFLQLEVHARLMLTDSGGVQEESCILGVPCVTLRDNTERPETVAVGSNLVVGVEPASVTAGVETMLAAAREWENPFGDGSAGSRIVDLVEEALSTRQVGTLVMLGETL